MMHSTIFRKTAKCIAGGFAIAVFWLGIWQLAYKLIAWEALLVSPMQAIGRLWELSKESLFWRSIAFTCLRVLAGFLLALIMGTLLAVVCARLRILHRLFQPLMGVIRATPVVSFIILALVWLRTDNVPVFAAFLMVLPVIWGNVYTGIVNTSRDLLEMAKVFHLGRMRTLRYIYLPAVLPHFASASTAGLGFAWKSAVAAEVIALPALSVGRQLHNAKIYLDTADLFAWTMAVILMSLAVEKGTSHLLRKISIRLGASKEETADAADDS